jgi:hypothetical protein
MGVPRLEPRSAVISTHATPLEYPWSTPRLPEQPELPAASARARYSGCYVRPFRYSRGTLGVLTGYSRGTHGVLTGYSRGTHRVLQGYSRGAA